MRFEEPAVDTADEADVAEQQATLDDSAFGRVRAELPLEADPVDVAEQDQDAPYDDER